MGAFNPRVDVRFPNGGPERFSLFVFDSTILAPEGSNENCF
jgi:hypothetical protein